MKKLTLIIVFVIGFTINAQDTIEKTVGEFTTVKVYDLINLKISMITTITTTWHVTS